MEAPELSPDGHHLAYVGGIGGPTAPAVEVMDLDTGARVVLDHTAALTASLQRRQGLVWSADGRWLFWVTADGTLRAWHVGDASPITVSGSGHIPALKAIGLAPLIAAPLTRSLNVRYRWSGTKCSGCALSHTVPRPAPLRPARRRRGGHSSTLSVRTASRAGSLARRWPSLRCLPRRRRWPPIPRPRRHSRRSHGGWRTRLAALLERERQRWADVDADLVDIFATMAELVLAPAKRLRPSFCYWGYVGAGGSPDDAGPVDAGAAFELLHAFALFHDDVMDGSAVRRGRRTCPPRPRRPPRGR